MIKKISAIALALVLCLSVVVLPASAADLELGDASIAFSLKWDKESYSAGDTAYLSVYMDAADDLALFTGSFIIGLNSSVFSQTDNPIATVKENAVGSELFESYWKSPTTNLSWLASTVVPRVQAQNTADENALYDQYLKFTAAKNINGTHANAGNNMDGFYGSEFDPTEPIMTIALKVSDTVADGTAVNAAITSGSLKCTPVQTTWKYYNNPGSASTATNVAAAAFDVSQTVVSASIGAAEKVYEDSIVSYWKDQIKFDANEDESYAGTFSVRHLAVIPAADWESNFGTDEDAQAEGTKNITDIGFIFAQGAAFDKDEAANWLEAGANDNSFTKKSVGFVSTGMKGQEGNYVYSVTITGISDKNAELSSLGYVAWTDADGAEHYSYFETVATETFTELYDTYYSQQFGA